MTEFCWVCWSKKNSHFQGWGLLIRRCFCCSPFLASTYMKLTYQEGPESAESRILYSLEMALCGLCKFLVPDTATFHEDLCSLSWKGEFFFFFLKYDFLNPIQMFCLGGCPPDFTSEFLWNVMHTATPEASGSVNLRKEPVEGDAWLRNTVSNHTHTRKHRFISQKYMANISRWDQVR